MLKRKLGLLVAAAVMVGMFTSCLNVNVNKEKENTPQGNEEQQGDEVDYTSYTTDYSLIVENQTTLKLVAFKGAPAKDTLIGGINPNATTCLKNDTSLFNATESFVLFVVKETDYEANKNDFNKLAQMPFTSFFAFYNQGEKNENHYIVSAVMDGPYQIIVNNPSKYNVEFRNMSITGNVIGYVAPSSYEQTFHVKKGEYMLFPVFKVYDSKTMEIVSTYPTYKAGKLAGEPKSFEFSLDEETTKAQFNTKKWTEDIKFTPSAAYIKIINNADQGVQFFKGELNVPETTSTGGKRINTDKSLTFPLDMELIGNNNTYEEAKVVAGYRIETNRGLGAYLNGDATTTVTYKAGYLYTYTVSGNATDGYTITPLKGDDGELLAQAVDWANLVK